MRRETLQIPRTLYINRGYLDPKPNQLRAHLAANAAIKRRVTNNLIFLLICIYLDHLMLFLQRGCYAPRPFANPPHQEDTWTLSQINFGPIWQQAAIKPSDDSTHQNTLYIFV